MAKILLSAYAGVAVYFLSAYLQRPTVAGVVASLLWPLALALALAWLMMVDDDDLASQAIGNAAASPDQHGATGRGRLASGMRDHPGTDVVGAAAADRGRGRVWQLDP